MISNLKVSNTVLIADSMVLLKELKQIAPDIWEGDRRHLILPRKLGDLEKREYMEYLQGIIRKLYKYQDMLNAELISEVEYESKKAEVLHDFGAKISLSPFRDISRDVKSYGI